MRIAFSETISKSKQNIIILYLLTLFCFLFYFGVIRISSRSAEVVVVKSNFVYDLVSLDSLAQNKTN